MHSKYRDSLKPHRPIDINEILTLCSVKEVSIMIFGDFSFSDIECGIFSCTDQTS